MDTLLINGAVKLGEMVFSRTMTCLGFGKWGLSSGISVSSDQLSKKQELQRFVVLACRNIGWIKPSTTNLEINE